jgi:hypothetical protein
MSYFLFQPVCTTNSNNIYHLFVFEPCTNGHLLRDVNFKLNIQMYCDVLTCIETAKTGGPACQEGPKEVTGQRGFKKKGMYKDKKLIT